MHRPSICCLLPAATLTRDLPPAKPAAVADPEPDLPLQDPSSLTAFAAFRWSGSSVFTLREPGYADAPATVPASTRSRVAVCACLSTRTTTANCPAILLAPFSSPAAPAVRLPYRDVLAMSASTYPHPQVRSISRSVSGFM
ncbi:protein of unknown function (plasmid) [Paraburkholderia dioscoreae]|uniref:Uncharacterized protein n=1 Tax=Paraburkholderia dioscoreae TaxID=2604047 RepID=A0A5Q4YV48_9BURK|nr:protein of unknown function [Paraburkholderia dioscoreae]